MKDVDLATPGKIGALKTPNRIVMAPMTRSRVAPNDVPSEMAIEYNAALQSGLADFIVYGNPFIATPDPPARFATTRPWPSPIQAFSIRQGRRDTRIGQSSLRHPRNSRQRGELQGASVRS